MSRKHAHASHLSRRLLMFWLPLVLLILAAVYWSQARYNPAREANAGLEQLNQWRKQAGLTPLSPQSSLQQAAQKHAQYLSRDADGHDETNRRNPHFTGATPQERASAAGYSAPIVENLAISNWARSGRASINGLMTALYHRMALLTPNHDEAGAAWVKGKHQAFVVVQGSSRLRQLCDAPPSQANAPYILKIPCHGTVQSIPSQQPLYPHIQIVKFPVGNYAEPDYDGKEIPNPMPNHKQTGNPISIAFYGNSNPIQLLSFQLFAPDGEIKATHLLTHSNDPNHLLDNTEFALFPIEPLAFDTEYRAEVRYRINRQDKSEIWTFKTRPKRHWFE